MLLPRTEHHNHGQRRCIFCEVRYICCILVLLTLPGPASAQNGTANSGPITLRGRVVRGDTAAGAYSTVEVVEAGSRQFADADGEFIVPGLNAGRYHIRARQLGFAPLDTTIALTVESTAVPILLRLHVIPVLLNKIVVKAEQVCTHPGIDSTADPSLVAILSAVRENAERELLLRRSYPFAYGVEDVITNPDPPTASKPKLTFDTLYYRSDVVVPYVRGEVVFNDTSRSGEVTQRMRLPSTLDFADTTFLAAHCLSYAGSDSGVYSVRFSPVVSIRTQDVGGIITLDTSTYLIKSSIVRLTAGKMRGFALPEVEARTTFTEVLPTVPMVAGVTSTQRIPVRTWGRTAYRQGPTEHQAILMLRFLGPVPDGAPREQSFPRSP